MCLNQRVYGSIGYIAHVVLYIDRVFGALCSSKQTFVGVIIAELVDLESIQSWRSVLLAPSHEGQY